MPPEVKSYQMTVVAEVNSVSYARIPVHFTVREVSTDISDIKFSRPYYSVVISDDLKKGDKIFDLSIASAKAAQHIVYNISGENRYFAIDEQSGTIKLKRNLSEFQLSPKSSKQLQFTVVTRLRESTTIAASTIIYVIVVPAFSGDNFDHLVEVPKTDDLTNERTVTPPRSSEFAFHRFFRQLSPTARNISKAEIAFDRVIQGLRESVVDKFTGKHRNYLSEQGV